MTPLPLLAVLTTQSFAPMARLRTEMDAACARFQGRIGYYVKNLKTGETIGNRDRERFPSASTIKTVIMIEVVNQIEAGRFAWKDKIMLPPKEKRSTSMWAAYLPDSTELNIEGLTNLMMNVSDNTAAIMLSEKVGVENIEKRMLSWGLVDTACTIREPASNERLRRLHETFANMGVTSPRDMGRILEKLYRKQAAKSPAASERMLRIMSDQYWDDFFASQIPPTVTVCSKVGALERSRSDSAIVLAEVPYILTAYTDNAKDRSWTDTNEGHEILRTLSRMVWNALEPQQPYTAPKDSGRWFPTGSGVE